MNKIVVLSILFNIAIAKNMNDIMFDEQILIETISLGLALHQNCVMSIPMSPEEGAKCMTLEIAYNRFSDSLIFPGMQVMMPFADPFSISEFSACKTELSHVILFEICGII